MAGSAFRASADYLALRHHRRRRCYWRRCSDFSSSVATPQVGWSVRAFARVNVRCKAVARPRPRSRSSSSRSWCRDWIASTTSWFDVHLRLRRRRRHRYHRRHRRHERRCISPARHRLCLTIVPPRMQRFRPSVTSSKGCACTSASTRICGWSSRWTRRSSTGHSALVCPIAIPPWRDHCVPRDRKAGTAPIETNSLVSDVRAHYTVILFAVTL